MKHFLLAITLLGFLLPVLAQKITVRVNTQEGRRVISPYIYGRNNNFSNVFGTATPSADIQLYKEAGLKFARENTGNNATKYNWRKKISSHPDWYNNVYDHNWDYSAQTIQTEMPGIQTMWAFQLIGKAADNKRNNFNDWAFNRSQWWNGCSQNLAGGGQVNRGGGKTALVEGNPDLYLMDWPSDSTVAILNHWFGDSGLGLNSNNLTYWSMDNEPELWFDTHDDVMSVQISASEYMTRYFDVAKKAREIFPGIKLSGPVPANEWQWFVYSNETLNLNGRNYCWLEYFIKGVADEQKATGIRLLDVLDIHWYPKDTTIAESLQLHRIFFDKNYVYPNANGLKKINGGWEASLNKEYIFQRINDWLTKYFGENHGITLALSEYGTEINNPNVNAVLYASLLGTFANNGVEIFTPWTWKTGMWETLHLFSRYAKNIAVSTTSSLEYTVSGYTSISSDSDSMTIILVNRDISDTREVIVDISGLSIPDGSYTTLTLASLPSTETFISHNENALIKNSVDVTADSFTVMLPSLSTTAIVLKTTNYNTSNSRVLEQTEPTINVYPNPSSSDFSINFHFNEPVTSVINMYNHSGQLVDEFLWEKTGESPFLINTYSYDKGLYLVKVTNHKFSKTCKLMISK